MANTKSAKKNVRKNEKRRLINAARRTELKTTVKKVTASVEGGADKAAVEQLLSSVAAQLARAKSKKTIHPNTAARKMSRLARMAAKAQRSTRG